VITIIVIPVSNSIPCSGGNAHAENLLAGGNLGHQARGLQYKNLARFKDLTE